MSANRGSMTHFFTTARGETRLALAALPGIAGRLLIVLAWAFLAILMGSIVGFASVTLPPLGLAGIIAVFVLILLWVLPESRPPSDKLIRKLCFALVIVDIAIPNYYALQLPGTPWISARRFFTLLLIMVFAVAYSSSQAVRQRVHDVIRENKLLFVCIAGFLFMIVASIFTSISPFTSLSSLSDSILEWYIPFIAVIYVIRDNKDADLLLRVICVCGLFVSLMGIAEPFLGRHTYVMLMPKFVSDNLASNNPELYAMFNTLPMRNGQYRASSLFTTALSFAEFEAMIAPLGAIYLFHGGSWRSKALGAATIVACFAGIYASGSRGGYLSFLIAGGMFVTLYVVRSTLIAPRSLAGPIFAIMAGSGMTLVTAAILFVRRINNIIFAGAEGDSSNQARIDEWMMAMPKIFANPVTGHGFGLSGAIVGYRSSPNSPLSVDSFLLSLVVETGLPSVLFYFGTAVVAAWFGSRQYLRDRTQGGPLAAGVACAITAFASYRFFLSQRENQTLFFILVACAAVLQSFYLRATAQQPRPRFERAAPSPRVRAVVS